MIGLAFLNPLLLSALPLAAVPIIIHLLNRRRFKTVPWAAMEYLLAALKRNRKRLRMEQWLVLLLRVLAVLLLVFLVSRPRLGGGGILRTTTHHVVLLDDSASMRQRAGSGLLFDRAKDRVRELADRLGQTRSGDLFSLVRSSLPARPDIWAARVGPDLGSRIGAMLAEMSASDATMDLGSLLDGSRRRASEQEEAQQAVFHLVTDLRASDWLTESDKPRPDLLAALAGLEPGTLEVLPVAAPGSDNLAVAQVARTDRVSTVGLPTSFSVSVRNLGLDALGPGELAVEFDGKSRITRPIPRLAPGETRTLDLQQTFYASGPHRLDAFFATPLDAYAVDDKRTLAFDVVDRIHLLLVDGEPGERSDESETFYLGVALDPGGDAVSGNDVQIVPDSSLDELDLSEFDMVWLCNVPSPSESAAEKLEEYVSSGGGLVVFLGGQVDVSRYNDVFYKQGQGLFPLEIGEILGDPDRPEHAFLANPDHWLVHRLAPAFELVFSKALLVRRYLAMKEPGATGASVVARVRDAEGPPLIATKRFGTPGGEVIVVAVTADKHWSNLPDTIGEVVLANEMRRTACRIHDVSGANLTTTGSLRLELDPGKFKADATVASLVDAGEELTVTAVDREDGAGSRARSQDLVIPMDELRSLGAYSLELKGHGGEPVIRLFARNAPVEESRLVPLQRSLFQKSFPVEAQDRVIFLGEGQSLSSGSGEGEIWRLLAGALLAGLLLESLLAWRFGRR
ncbi:MAG: hypothetical protein Fur0037_04140 [Planctomycetota bacterium]